MGPCRDFGAVGQAAAVSMWIRTPARCHTGCGCSVCVAAPTQFVRLLVSGFVPARSGGPGWAGGLSAGASQWYRVLLYCLILGVGVGPLRIGSVAFHQVPRLLAGRVQQHSTFVSMAGVWCLGWGVTGSTVAAWRPGTTQGPHPGHHCLCWWAQHVSEMRMFT